VLIGVGTGILLPAPLSEPNGRISRIRLSSRCCAGWRLSPRRGQTRSARKPSRGLGFPSLRFNAIADLPHTRKPAARCGADESSAREVNDGGNGQASRARDQAIPPPPPIPPRRRVVGSTFRRLHISSAPHFVGSTFRRLHISPAPHFVGSTFRRLHISSAPLSLAHSARGTSTLPSGVVALNANVQPP